MMILPQFSAYIAWLQVAVRREFSVSFPKLCAHHTALDAAMDSIPPKQLLAKMPQLKDMVLASPTNYKSLALLVQLIDVCCSPRFPCLCSAA
jgi:hypothetical protein